MTMALYGSFFRRALGGLLIVGVLLAAMALTGCNTVVGFGRDIEAAGHWMQDSAD